MVCGSVWISGVARGRDQHLSPGRQVSDAPLVGADVVFVRVGACEGDVAAQREGAEPPVGTTELDAEEAVAGSQGDDERRGAEGAGRERGTDEVERGGDEEGQSQLERCQEHRPHLAVGLGATGRQRSLAQRERDLGRGAGALVADLAESGQRVAELVDLVPGAANPSEVDGASVHREADRPVRI